MKKLLSFFFVLVISLNLSTISFAAPTILSAEKILEIISGIDSSYTGTDIEKLFGNIHYISIENSGSKNNKVVQLGYSNILNECRINFRFGPLSSYKDYLKAKVKTVSIVYSFEASLYDEYIELAKEFTDLLGVPETTLSEDGSQKLQWASYTLSYEPSKCFMYSSVSYTTDSFISFKYILNS